MVGTWGCANTPVAVKSSAAKTSRARNMGAPYQSFVTLVKHRGAKVTKTQPGNDILRIGGFVGMRKLVFFMAAAALCAGGAIPVVAQRSAMTVADYARAEKFMAYNVTPLVYRSGVRGNWLPDDRMW